MAQKPLVYIVGHEGGQYHTMFEKFGWDIAQSIVEANLVQFLGGADVTPALYGHTQHARTNNSPMRDKKEQLIYYSALKYDKPMAGICRGGQFLNVMNGGTMWQDVSNHCGRHMADYTTLKEKGRIEVTSTHHQMMIPSNNNKEFLLLMVAHQKGWRVKCSKLRDTNLGTVKVNNATIDVEALFYTKTKSLCFQPHPEFAGEDRLADLYFKYINMLILNK